MCIRFSMPYPQHHPQPISPNPPITQDYQSPPSTHPHSQGSASNLHPNQAVVDWGGCYTSGT